MPELGDLNLVALLGGPFTLAGFAWLAAMFIRYQRDFTDQYRQRLQRQGDRIRQLETDVRGLKEREERTRRRLLDCARERHALRVEVTRAGIAWDPNLWNFADDTDDADQQP